MFNRLPAVTKNILLINIVLFLACQAFPVLDGLLAVFYFDSPHFRPWQVISHMFMHGSFMHIFFNMFGVYMFGAVIESYWGGKKFLWFYILSGIGALALHEFISWQQVHQAMQSMPPSIVEGILNGTVEQVDTRYIDSAQTIYNIINVPLVGASGCLFGLLMAYGFMFPNSELMLMFIPFPVKAKYFVIGYGAIELLQGLSNRTGDNVAHFAHIGGMIMGYILLKYWQKQGKLYS
jgi:membrane associated rhomboid family serine protease